MKSVDNPISRILDFWLASLLEGFITEFAVDQRKSFNEAEKVLLQGISQSVPKLFKFVP